MWKALVALVEKWSCMHKWQKKNGIKYFEFESDKLPTHRVYLYCCEKCGKFKKVRI